MNRKKGNQKETNREERDQKERDWKERDQKERDWNEEYRTKNIICLPYILYFSSDILSCPQTAASPVT